MRKLKILKNHYFLAALVMLAGLGVRLLKFDQLASFAHDNSRDLIINYKMFYGHELVYRGPVFSVIWGYLSPIYYYILLPFHLLFNFHPLSGPILTMIFCMAASLLAFLFLRKNISALSGFVTLALYSFSVLFLKHSLDGLNNSLLPPLAVLGLIACYKLFVQNEEKYLKLFVLTFALLIALHPSGIFMLVPFVVFSLIYKIKYSRKTIGLSAAIFGLVALLPYFIQEKKLGWWTVKKTFSYFSAGGGSPFSFLSIKNYFIITLENLSLGVFGSTETMYLILSGAIIALLVYEGVSYFKKRSGYYFISFFILIYYLSFGLLMRHGSLATNERWFFSVYIPLMYIYLGMLLAKIAGKSKLILILFALVYFGSNANTFVTWVPDHETYYYEKLIANVVKKDANGADLDIYGVNPEPDYYIMWYTEKNPLQKERYYKWIKWTKVQDSSLVYWVLPAGKNIADNIVGKYTNIYTLPDGNVIYRVE